jgi:hypothetical protein
MKRNSESGQVRSEHLELRKTLSSKSVPQTDLVRKVYCDCKSILMSVSELLADAESLETDSVPRSSERKESSP